MKKLALLSVIGVFLACVILSGCNDDNRHHQHHDEDSQAQQPQDQPSPEPEAPPEPTPTETPKTYHKELNIYSMGSNDSTRFTGYQLIDGDTELIITDGDGTYTYEKQNISHYEEVLKEDEKN